MYVISTIPPERWADCLLLIEQSLDYRWYRVVAQQVGCWVLAQTDLMQEALLLVLD